MVSIPNYTITKKIGEGGMAEVYLATHEILQRPVALKVMSANLIKDKSFKDSFIKEGQIMAKLKHPHIVEIYDIGVSNDLCYMALEILEKDSLKDKLAKERLLITEIVKIITQLSDAIQYAHDQGYIHRDIKPANTLFRQNGDVVLTDFGISKLQGTVGELTQMGYLIGSPYYMSPEQAQGQTLDHRSDIYSLGIVFYEMLTGKKPFSGVNTVAITYEHVHADIPTLSTEFQHFQPILNKVLAKDTSERYAKVSDFSNALLVASQANYHSDHDDATVVLPHSTQTLETQENKTKKPVSLKKPIIITASLLSLIVVGVLGIVNDTSLSRLLGGQQESTASTDTPRSVTSSRSVGTPVAESKTEETPVTMENEKHEVKSNEVKMSEVNHPSQQQASKERVPEVTTASQSDQTTYRVTEQEHKSNTEKKVDNSLVISSLLDNSLGNFRSVVKTFIRIQKAQQNLEDYKQLAPDAGRTKFITSRKKAIAEFEQQKKEYERTYCDNVLKLGQYQITEIEPHLNKAITTKYTKPVYSDVSQLLLKQITKAQTKTLKEQECVNDLLVFAKNFSQSIQ